MMLYVTDSMLLWIAENIAALRPRSPFDLDDHEHPHARKPYVYIATICLLLILFHHVFSSEKGLRSALSHIPMYHASKWKWWFGAENLLKESYREVRFTESNISAMEY
jgi:hypothetical protein